jgi:hypothetical protein
MKRFLRFLTQALLILVLFRPASAPAQAPAPPPRELDLVVLEGEGAINNVRQRSTHEPVVQVEDENHRPIAGAGVVFTLPTEGPSGEFGGSKTLTIMTDSQGRAVAAGLRSNQVAGRLVIRVGASYRGLTTQTTITQFNMQVPGAKGGGSGKTIAILAVIGAAAAGGAVAATHKGSSSTTPTPTPPAPAIGITAGTVTVGPPR